jgi:hypothetical protein
MTEFLRRSLNLNVDQVQVCPTQGDSTDEETRYVAQCLHTDPVYSLARRRIGPFLFLPLFRLGLRPRLLLSGRGLACFVYPNSLGSPHA